MEEADDFEDDGEEGEDSFDDDFGEEGEDSVVGSDEGEDFDVEAYL